MVVVLIFTGLFETVDVDWGDHPRWISSFYYSVVTLTTLGYGDVIPASTSAKVLAIIGVVIGYLMLGGLFIETSKSLPVGADCDVTVRLGEGTDPVEILCRGTVNRSGPGGMAVEFSGVDGDSSHHLRRLVLYNAADPDRVERELGEHTNVD